MRMIDLDKKCSVKYLAMFLTPSEAMRLSYELHELLDEPEADRCFHLSDEHMCREISCSIITEKKLANLKRYNQLEQQILSED